MIKNLFTCLIYIVMKGSGYGNYAELSNIKKNMNPDDYHDVYDDSFTDWTTLYNSDSEINIDCIKNSLKEEPKKEEPKKKESFDDDDDKFWSENPSILFRGDKILTIIPNCDMSKTEYYNTIMRLCVYGSIVLAYCKDDVKYLLLIIAAMLITIFLHANDVQNLSDLFAIINGKKKKEKFYGLKANSAYSENTVYNDDMNKTMLSKLDGIEGTQHIPINSDVVCSTKSLNNTTGGYNWIDEDSHASFRGNSRFLNKKTSNPVMNRLFKDIADVYGEEIAARNSYVPNHPRDFINTNFDEFLYGKNLDRKLYYGRR